MGSQIRKLSSIVANHKIPTVPATKYTKKTTASVLFCNSREIIRRLLPAASPVTSLLKSINPAKTARYGHPAFGSSGQSSAVSRKMQYNSVNRHKFRSLSYKNTCKTRLFSMENRIMPAPQADKTAIPMSSVQLLP